MKLDFSSSLYLGMGHSHGDLSPWEWLTYGKPAALAEPANSLEVAHHFARLMGCEAGVFGASTLHLFWDLFGMMEDVVIFVDDGVYPIMEWGISRAKGRRVPVVRFKHRDPDSLAMMLKRYGVSSKKPVVVCDGFCPGCGRAVPIRDYLALVEKYQGWLLIDDTQALGIFGYEPRRNNPYGEMGGGSLRWNDIGGCDNVLLVSSLAKGFGVPIALLAGSARALRSYHKKSEVAVFCSPPSAATVNAAAHAFMLNKNEGAQRRFKLRCLVASFRRQLRALGLTTLSSCFPVQTLAPREGFPLDFLYGQLKSKGVCSVLHGPHIGGRSRLSFILTSAHQDCHINHAVKILERTLHAMHGVSGFDVGRPPVVCREKLLYVTGRCAHSPRVFLPPF